MFISPRKQPVQNTMRPEVFLLHVHVQAKPTVLRQLLGFILRVCVGSGSVSSGQQATVSSYSSHFSRFLSSKLVQ